MRLIAVFDDTVKKSEVIEDVIGSKGFSDVVVNCKRLEEHYLDKVKEIFPEVEKIVVRSPYEFNELLQKIDSPVYSSCKVLHCYANFIISDFNQACLSLKKLDYIEESYKLLCDQKLASIMFSSTHEYVKFLQQLCLDGSSVNAAKNISEFICAEGFADIGNITNFIQCITGNFDSRYFNSLEESDNTLTKRSTNKKKIEAEYKYYHLLPDNMKYWFVMPFDYKENESSASYMMERLYMTDLAIKWVHGSIDEIEFEQLMDKYFCFFKCRHEKIVSKEIYDKTANELYVKKVINRIRDLKAFPEYTQISKMLVAGCNEKTIDDILEHYLNIKEKVERKYKYPLVSVIGHGDPCFANALYNKATRMLKFIDPKGALTEEELWTDPYYDVAKLSHSVCEGYDFFNNGLYEIKIDSKFQYELKISFDNAKYKKIFRQKVEQNGYDYWSVRIYEASLFLSMLPLHIDNPHKVFGFILNINNILKEIEENV